MTREATPRKGDRVRAANEPVKRGKLHRPMFGGAIGEVEDDDEAHVREMDEAEVAEFYGEVNE